MFDFCVFITDTQSIVLAAILLLSLIFSCLYFGYYHFRLGRWHAKKVADTEKLPPVSVVLTARNESVWLKENLVYLLEQDYPDFEVVVVNYQSHDDTEQVLKLLKGYYPHLKVVPFPKDVNLFQGKKYPLSIGIQSAKNDVLLLADPECTPKNMKWLRGMVKGYYRDDVQMVLGFCGLTRKKSLLGLLQRYDNLAYSANYLGSALLGHPYTATGRNLSYRRSFFFDRGAFVNHYQVAGGADDLFVYQNATRKNTAICIDDDALLTTEAKPTFSQWHRQRLDRVSTRNWHSVGGRVIEDLPALAALLFYGTGAGLLLLGTLPWVTLVAAVVLRWTWQMVSFAQLCKRFDGGWIYLLTPLLEIYFIIANTILVLTPLRGKRK